MKYCMCYVSYWINALNEFTSECTQSTFEKAFPVFVHKWHPELHNHSSHDLTSPSLRWGMTSILGNHRNGWSYWTSIYLFAQDLTSAGTYCVNGWSQAQVCQWMDFWTLRTNTNEFLISLSVQFLQSLHWDFDKYSNSNSRNFSQLRI